MAGWLPACRLRTGGVLRTLKRDTRPSSRSKYRPLILAVPRRMVSSMNQSTGPQNQSIPRPPRRRLIGRPSNVVPSPPPEMARAYNQQYRRKMLSDGIPDRRMLAEPLMQAVIEEAMSTTPDAAKRILRSSADILKSIVGADNRPIYHNEGIKRRIAKVANELRRPARHAVDTC